MKKAAVQFKSATQNPENPEVKDVEVMELSKMANAVHLIDVRRPEEFTGELGHIAGAQLMVLDTLPERIRELPKDEPIVFVCRSGARSGRATAFALDQGFQHVYNMKGGMLNWNQQGLPIEK